MTHGTHQTHPGPVRSVGVITRQSVVWSASQSTPNAQTGVRFKKRARYFSALHLLVRRHSDPPRLWRQAEEDRSSKNDLPTIGGTIRRLPP
jgi:hypothetical protein